ncbi:hypothetical protein N7462_002808 [Penicillium macrosclerotiorum]|uniref:uncharacterized protein n=1 Tax=Penicillium macrosclerotiorum TaxID=303699 RepID=UPI0025470887|nr:uncharacterized protein N7462_002808 [Penicillium macrosclerotiorum]KAJ5693385.1 hypothetical protein N7462_002808 [Penicillium macrosclerotiorum]
MGNSTATTESERAAYLRDAEEKAAQLFIEIERDLVRPGISEKTLNSEIYHLGFDRYGIKTHWHKREDDILVVDLGPVFEAWEADFGRTYVLGGDPHKKRLRDALQPIWDIVKAQFDANPNMSGEELYDIACGEAQKNGFDFGADIAGHLVGSFPHERIPKDRTTLYITKGNTESMNQTGKDGFKRHWILEIHLRDTARGFGGFTEQLLTVN